MIPPIMEGEKQGNEGLRVLKKRKKVGISWWDKEKERDVKFMYLVTIFGRDNPGP